LSPAGRVDSEWEYTAGAARRDGRQFAKISIRYARESSTCTAPRRMLVRSRANVTMLTTRVSASRIARVGSSRSTDLHEMRVIGSPDATLEPQLLVELGRRRVLRAQAKPLEPTPRRVQHPFDQSPADAQAPVVRQHVQMTDSADPRCRRIRIDVEPAGTDQAPIHPGREEGLAGTLEPIRPAGPLVGEPAHESVSGALALGDQGVEETRRRLGEALDLDTPRARHHTHTPSSAVRSLWASPVLTVPAGSISIMRHSRTAEGLCSTPRGTTNISPARRATSPSRRWMVISPSSTMKTSSVSGWVCQMNSP